MKNKIIKLIFIGILIFIINPIIIYFLGLFLNPSITTSFIFGNLGGIILLIIEYLGGLFTIE